MSTTKRARYVFTVKESNDGTPWIALEPQNESIELPNDGLLGFDLPKGTDINKAREAARYMNENLAEFTFTSS